MTTWLFRPVALARVAWLRTALYLFVPVDVLLTTTWVAEHGTAPASFWSPVLVARLLHHPAPDHAVVTAVQVALVGAALLAATGRAPRLLGTAVALLYGEWMLIAMSWGKVDHDRFALLVALAVLPTVGAARHRDRTPSEAAGFAVRSISLAVVATYLLSVAAKARYGGGLPHWLDSAVFVRAVLRRGTVLGEPLLQVPVLLHLGQYALVAMELGSVALLFLTGRRLYAAIGAYVAFHVMTWACIAIVFLPHVVCLLAFLPLERLLPERPGLPVPAQRGPGEAAGPPAPRSRRHRRRLLAAPDQGAPAAQSTAAAG